MATAEELAASLVHVRADIASLKEREADLVQRLAAEMPEKRLEVPGLGVFERHRKADRKAWKHQELQSTLIRKLRNGKVRKLHDAETGEVIDEDDIERTARVFIETANPKWRVTALAKYDIDASEYNETTFDGGYTVQFTAAGVS